MAKILIIDDDIFICKAIHKQLINKGFHAEVAFTGESGLKMVKKHAFDLVLCDFRLPDKDGLKVLKEIKRIDNHIPVIIITAYADVRVAVKLIKQGAYDYMVKPLHSEEILSLVKQLTGKNKFIQSHEGSDNFIMGSSRSFKEAVSYASKVAPTDMAVLIEGETGTGKENIARYIHEHSKRSDKPFIAVDCGAIPKELAGSELFGHVKGSFTGAIDNKTGVFQEADGGTLFLDEIGNLGYGVQMQLLRVLQEKVLTRIGENKLTKVDVRIIAASNEKLSIYADENMFREDLLHRINEFKIVLPPLRERRSDIPLFARHFMKMANRELGLNRDDFAKETLNLLTEYEWPGNIRELKNVVKRAVLLSTNGIIRSDTLPAEIVRSVKEKNSSQKIDNKKQRNINLKNVSVDVEKDVILKAIEDAGYNKSKAARLLGIDRKTLYNKIKQYNIDI